MSVYGNALLSLESSLIVITTAVVIVLATSLPKGSVTRQGTVHPLEGLNSSLPTVVCVEKPLGLSSQL